MNAEHAGFFEDLVRAVRAGERKPPARTAYASPYAYTLESGLALGLVKPSQLAAIGLDPLDYRPDPGFITASPAGTYAGFKMPAPARAPYPASDSVIAALSRGLVAGVLTYDELDRLGYDPLYLVPDNLA